MGYSSASNDFQRLLVWFGCVLFASSVAADEPVATIPAKFVPDGRRLLIIGQELEAVGGTKLHHDGYFEHVSQEIGGVTVYSSLPSLSGLKSVANWGAGDTSAQAIVDSPNYKNSALSIGLYLVGELPAIGRGDHDRAVTDLAKWIASAKRPVFLRIGYEFDGQWNDYQPEAYKVAFRRIVDVFRNLQVTNCAFVWQSSTSPYDDLIEGKHENIADWYPGDEYVDWCGMSWFISTKMQHELADELVTFARAHKKPVMVCETSCQSYDLTRKTRRNMNKVLDGGPPAEGLQHKTSQQIWDEWFVPMLAYVNKNSDVIRAVAYINTNWDSQPMWGPPYKEGYWGDTRIQQDALILKKWKTEIKKPIWLHSCSLPGAAPSNNK